MPNHIHGILFIEKSVETRLIASNIDNNFNSEEKRLIASNIDNNFNSEEKRSIASNIDINFNSEETRLIASLRGGVTKNMNPMLNENISRIIRWYKGRCSFEIRKITDDFGWQPRFHDHVIRDSKSFETIKTILFQILLLGKLTY